MWDMIVSVPDHCLSFYYARGPRFESLVGPYTLSSPVTNGGSVCVHFRAVSSEKTVLSHCSCEPISLPNVPPETQSTCKNVSKAYETITLK